MMFSNKRAISTQNITTFERFKENTKEEVFLHAL